MRDQIAILGIAEGFLPARILFALLRLDVFERIGEGRRTAAELAAPLGAAPERLARLLRAGVNIDLLDVDGEGRFGLPERVRGVLLEAAGDRYLGNNLRNLDHFATTLADLDRAAAGSGPTADLAAQLGDDERSRSFTLAMHDYAALRGRELTHFLDTKGCRSLLDLGCGPGTYALQLAAANPDLTVYLLDRQEVLATTAEIVARHALPNPVHLLAQDAVVDPIPGSYDLVLLSNVLHMLGAESARALLARLHDSIHPGGSVVVQGQFLRDDRLGDRWPIGVDLLQLCMTEAGHNHTVAETRAWLADTGFTRIEHCAMSVYNTNGFVRGYR